MNVVFTASAKADLTAIGDYIAERDPQRAFSFIEELEAQANSVSFMPRSYPVVGRYKNQGVRRQSYGNYLIFYRIERESIRVLRILHGAMDYEKILFKE